MTTRLPGMDLNGWPVLHLFILFYRKPRPYSSLGLSKVKGEVILLRSPHQTLLVLPEPLPYKYLMVRVENRLPPI